MPDQGQETAATAATPILPVDDQLLLRPLDPEDAPALEPMLNDPLTREMFGLPAETSIIARDWIASQLAWQEQNAVRTTRFTWAIVLPGPGAVIGWVTLENLTLLDGGELEVCLNPGHRGRGYGPQVLNEVIRWAFEDLVPTFMFANGQWTGYRLGRVTALVMPHNTASIRMMQKTLLDDHGTVLARRTNPDDPPLEARHFYLMRPDYMQRHARHL
jgi:RimJ/RimL family protein N-acetyltransferase